MGCVHQDPGLELSRARRVTLYLIGVVESLLFAGTVFGWPQLVHLLKVEGVYSHLCVLPTSTYAPTLHPTELPLFATTSDSIHISPARLQLSTSAPTLPSNDYSHNGSQPQQLPLIDFNHKNPVPDPFLQNNSLSDPLPPNDYTYDSFLDPFLSNDRNYDESLPDSNTPNDYDRDDDPILPSSSLVLSSLPYPPATPPSSLPPSISSPWPDFNGSATEDHEPLSCEEQDNLFALIFTLGVCSFSLSGVAVGYLLHHAGLRVTRLSAGVMLAASFLCLSFASRSSPDLLFPTMVLLGLGGNQVRMGLMQLGDLFPRHRATAITLLTGLYASSASLFLLFQMLGQAGVSRAAVCWALVGLAVLSMLASFLMPPHHVPVTTHQEATRKQDPVALGRSLWSLSSALHLFWFTVGLGAINIYQSSYNVWVNMAVDGVEEAARFSAYFSYTNLLSIFAAPIGGAFTDRMIHRASREASEVERRAREMRASFWPLLATTLCTALMSGAKLFVHPVAVVLSLAGLCVSRPCVVATSTAFLRIRFPAEHFNRLLGVYMTVTAVFMFLQYPHFLWAQQHYYAAHATVLVLVGASLSYPLHLLATPYLRRAVIARDGLPSHQTKMMLQD